MARIKTNNMGGALGIGFSMVIGYLGLGHFFRHSLFVIDSSFGLRNSSFAVFLLPTCLFPTCLFPSVLVFLACPIGGRFWLTKVGGYDFADSFEHTSGYRRHWL